MAKYEIIDNFLGVADFDNIKNIMFNELNWHYRHGVSSEDKNDKDYFFVHLFMDNYLIEQQPSFYYAPVFRPIANTLVRFKKEIKAFMRVKGNLFPSTSTIIEHTKHVDYPFKHNGGLFSLNSCDGYTLLDDGTKIESVANRLLLFDASKKHASTTCTNQNVRVNINFNYM